MDDSRGDAGSKDPGAISGPAGTREAIEAENIELRQVLSIIAASFPTKLLLGKTGDRITSTIKRVIEGKPLFD